MCPEPTRLDAPFYAVPPESKKEAIRHRYAPTGMTPDFEEARRLADHHRNYDCPKYDDCLYKAAIANWPSFSCARCPLWERSNA